LSLVFSQRDLVKILTQNAAIALGLGDETGTLEAGKLADIIIVDGDPLTDIHAVLAVEVVIKEGRVVVDKR
jgi:imidazolonepropionase-like amidohydrolase